MSNLGERLKQLRLDKGLSQAAFGKIFNLDQSTISYYEKNIKQPYPDMLEKFADFFNVSTDYLLGRISMPNNTLIQKQYKDEQAERFYPINNDLLEGIPEKDKADALRDIEAFREFFKTKYKHLKK